MPLFFCSTFPPSSWDQTNTIIVLTKCFCFFCSKTWNVWHIWTCSVTTCAIWMNIVPNFSKCCQLSNSWMMPIKVSFTALNQEKRSQVQWGSKNRTSENHTSLLSKFWMLWLTMCKLLRNLINGSYHLDDIKILHFPRRK